MEFYKVLQSVLDEKGLSIPDAARLSGLTDSTIRTILVRKNKRVSLDVAFKLSAGLGVSIEHLNGEATQTKKAPSLSDEAIAVAHAYDGAGEGIKEGVRKMLDIELSGSVFKGRGTAPLAQQVKKAT